MNLETLNLWELFKLIRQIQLELFFRFWWIVFGFCLFYLVTRKY